MFAWVYKSEYMIEYNKPNNSTLLSRTDWLYIYIQSVSQHDQSLMLLECLQKNRCIHDLPICLEYLTIHIQSVINSAYIGLFNVQKIIYIFIVKSIWSNKYIWILSLESHFLSIVHWALWTYFYFRYVSLCHSR